MSQVETVLGLLLAVAALVTLARRLNVPYPAVLVLGGLALSFVPGLPNIQLRPDIIFLVFLPPLLYSESLTAPLRDFTRNLRPILNLAIGLVLGTTVVVAVVAHAVMPGLSWPLAFVLGAIVAPSDEVAVIEVAERLPLPTRVIAIVEGESLINDAISVVAYRMAVAAAATGVFVLWNAVPQFFLVGLGGTAVGLAVGWIVATVRTRLSDPAVETTISLLTPYFAYLSAEKLGVSGVLATVAVGLYIGRQAPRIASSRTRLQARALFEMLAFLLNGLLFIFTGIELRYVLHGQAGQSIGPILGYSAAVIAAIIVTRFVWVFAGAYLPPLLRRIRGQRPHAPPWQETTIIAWTGIRGGISLVTALAIPFATGAGSPIRERSTMIFIAFASIIVTLVVQGMSLPWLIRLLHLKGDDGPAREKTFARLRAAQDALARLNAVAATDGADKEAIDHLREHYEDKLRRYTAQHNRRPPGDRERRAETYNRLRHDLLHVERDTVLRLRDEGQISDEVLLDIQRDLDLEELRLRGDQDDGPSTRPRKGGSATRSAV